MKTYSLDELTDKYIGKKGTKKETSSKMNLDLIYWDKQLNRQDKNAT